MIVQQFNWKEIMRKFSRNAALMALFILVSGCATTKSADKVTIFETADISRKYEVLGPVDVRDEFAESNSNMLQGLAGYVSSDGRVSDQIPADLKARLDENRAKYKESIFNKLASKAKESGADAVIAAEYKYTPPFVSFSQNAIVTAKGTMVRYK
jgi:uncharacterized protein YbjQ (UPF0145 family)